MQQHADYMQIYFHKNMTAQTLIQHIEHANKKITMKWLTDSPTHWRNGAKKKNIQKRLKWLDKLQVNSKSIERT